MKLLSALLVGAIALTSSCSTAPANQNDRAVNDSDNPVIEAIMARRSIRQYKDIPVEREKLELIAECGINAPTGMFRQPWEVRIVDNPEYINEITQVYLEADSNAVAGRGFKNMFRNAPAVIFIAHTGEGTSEIDCGLMGENMILAAESLGLGTCCLGGPVRFMATNENARPYVEKLGLSAGYKLLYAIAVGYPDEAPDAKPRDTSKVKFVD